MKTLLISGDKTFKITVPEDARITFGPWSPPSAGDAKYGRTTEDRRGTLRIYSGGSKAKESILGVFSGVTSFRDTSIDYSERVAVREGNSMWKSDKDGYVEESKSSETAEWVEGTALLGTGATNGKKRTVKAK